MMLKKVFAGLVLIMVTSAGCATNAMVGHAGQREGKYFGDVGVTGYGTNLTIRSGSQVPKLSFIGDNSRVTVEEGAAVGRIEFWGNGNEVSIPHDMDPSVAQFGSNQIVRRPAGSTATAPAQG